MVIFNSYVKLPEGTFSGPKNIKKWPNLEKLNLLSLDNTHEMSDPIDHVDKRPLNPLITSGGGDFTFNQK